MLKISISSFDLQQSIGYQIWDDKRPPPSQDSGGLNTKFSFESLVNDGGLASAELYGKPMPTLLNISTRTNVRTDDKVLIGGFIITGSEQKTVIVRGIGPSLPLTGTLVDPVIEVRGDNVMIGELIVGAGEPSGAAQVIVRALGPSISVSDALANPTMQLHDANGATLAFKHDWKTRPDGSSQQAEIESTTIPPANDLESALVRRLAPGSYTAVVRGHGNTTGIGLVEACHLP